MASVDGLSRVLLGMAAVLAGMGIAGFASHSFAYVLALGLAVLFGAAGALNILATRNARARGAVFALVIVLAVIATYVFVVSRGGGPPGTKPTLTPWAPIAIALLATAGAGALIGRATRDPAVGVSAGLLVMAVVLALLAQIATVAYVPAALLGLIGLVGLAAAGIGRARGRSS